MFTTMRVRKLITVTILVVLMAFVPSVAAEEIALDKELFMKSDYLDIVYADGAIASVSYMKSEDLAQDYGRPYCRHAAQQPESLSRGIWIWNYSDVIGCEEQVMDKLAAHNIERVYIQVHDNLHDYAQFLNLARARGIVVFALDGAPEYIHDYSVLVERLGHIKSFNEVHGGARFDGFQVDVEPYLLPDFNLRKEYYVNQYLEMVRELKKRAGDDLQVSFALPFWFDKFSVDDKPLSYHVIDIADEVVIMSYRTDYNEMVRFTYPELCYASNIGKKIFLGIELTRLPDEQHFIVDTRYLIKFLRIESESITLMKDPFEGLPVFRKYTVHADRLTFHNSKGDLPSLLQTVPRFQSFAGYVIHSFSGLFGQEVTVPAPAKAEKH